jgi:hypothetical protein
VVKGNVPGNGAHAGAAAAGDGDPHEHLAVWAARRALEITW